jgi:hypothetical protein
LCQIGCHSDIVALGFRLAFENVDIVKHACISKGWLAKP